MSGDDRLIATSSQTVGPFFHFALTSEPNGRLVDRMTGPGEPVTLAARVSDGAGAPVVDAMIEVLQGGVFGRMPTGENGVCEFHIMRPGSMADTRPAGDAAHVHVCVFARGLLRQLHTRIYFAGDPALDTDPVLALVPEARRGTLLAAPDSADGSRWIFDLRLQGDRETVFFDG
jgi:protocatechuate 3,4-dioxygenase, alpha subunit